MKAAPSPKRERCFSARLLQQAHEARVVLAATMQHYGCMVTVKQIRQFRINGRTPFAPGFRFARAIEPLVADGSLVVQRDDRAVFYGIAGHACCVLPGIAGRSNLARVEEALRRAVQATGGAVTLERVATEIADTAELTLDSGAASVHGALASLVRCERARSVRPPYGRHRRYYTTPNGPTAIASGTHTDIDQRRRAVQALWKQSGGRPFTTHALRCFAAADPDLRIVDDVPTGWTNALRHLEIIGELVGIRENGQRWVRWAPAREWSLLPLRERDRRLKDDYRAVPQTHAGDETAAVSPTESGLIKNACAHDVARVSQNSDMRAVVAIAEHHAIANAPDDAVRAILARRPVSRQQIIEAAEHYAHLLSVDKATDMLSEASRLHAGMVRRSIYNVGSVGLHTFFALTETTEARAFVECLRTAEELDAMLRADPLARLQHAETLTVDRATAVHPVLLYVRAMDLSSRLTESADTLEQWAISAPLLPDESFSVQRLLQSARECVREANVVAHRASGMPGMAASLVVMPAAEHFDPLEIDEAAVAITSVSRHKAVGGQEFSSWLPASGFGADALRRGKAWSVTGRGRRRQRVFDRVGIAGLAALRWGGPTWATVGAAAVHTMGELRDPRPLITLLRAGLPAAYHAGLLASLGFFDDRESRAALVEYLNAAIVAEQGGALLAPVHALTMAASGLAQKHVGGRVNTLQADERDALNMLAEWRAADASGACARRALRSWETKEAARRFFQS